MTNVFLLYLVVASLLVGASALIFRVLLIADGPPRPALRGSRGGSSRPDSHAPPLQRAA